MGDRQKAVLASAMKCLVLACGGLLGGHPRAHERSRQLLRDSAQEAFGQVGSVSCRVSSQWRKRLDLLQGRSAPECSVLPADGRSRRGCRRTGTRGGRHVCPQFRQVLPAANAGGQPFCPCLHPSCLADVSGRLWDCVSQRNFPDRVFHCQCSKTALVVSAG